MYRKLKSIVRKILKMTNSNVKFPDLDKSEYWLSADSAKRYAQAVSQKNLDSELNKIFCDYVDGQMNKNNPVLDLGAGTGAVSLELSRRGYMVAALDVSESMLNHLRKSDPRIKTIVSDAFSYRPSERYKFIVSRWFVPHFRQWPDLLKHVSENVLDKGGMILFDMPNSNHVDAGNKLNKKIPPEVFGYDHDPDASNYFYYAAASDADISRAADDAGLELVFRIPHGLFKSNMIIANSLGDTEFLKLRDNIGRMTNHDYGLDTLYSFEKYITPQINPDLVHGSIIMLRKT